MRLMHAANRAMYQAGRLTQLARAFWTMGNAEAALELVAKARGLRHSAQRIIERLPLVVA